MNQPQSFEVYAREKLGISSDGLSTRNVYGERPENPLLENFRLDIPERVTESYIAELTREFYGQMEMRPSEEERGDFTTVFEGNGRTIGVNYRVSEADCSLRFTAHDILTESAACD